MTNNVKFSDLLGKTIVAINGAARGSDEISFTTSDGDIFALMHEQDCCESVTVEDVTGNVDDLLNPPITMADESSNSQDDPVGFSVPEYRDSFTWTFYKLATVKGYMDIRWYGESNGYYSEAVSFVERNNTP